MNRVKHISQKVGQGLFIALATFFVLSILLIFLISLPPVQNRIVRTAKLWLENQTNTEVSIDRVSLGLPAEAVLQNVTVYDQKGEQVLILPQFRLSMLTFSLWRYLFQRQEIQTLQINKITLVEPNFNLYQFQKDSTTTLNIDFFIDTFSSSNTDKPQTEKVSRLDINLSEIEIRRGTLSWADSTSFELDSVYADRLNFSKVMLKDIDGMLGVSFSPSGRLHLRVDDLNFEEEQSGFKLKQFRLDLMSDTLMQQALGERDTIVPFIRINNLFAYTDATILSANLFFPNETLADLLDNELKEKWEIELKNSNIDFKTINYFLPNPLPLQGVITAEGDISGDLTRLSCPNFNLWYEDYTYIDASWTLSDLENPDDMLIDIRFDNSKFSAKELQRLLVEVELPKPVLGIDSLETSGSFLGKYYDFDLNMLGNSELGSFKSDIHIQLPPATKSIAYNGFLATQNFDLNSLTASSIKPSANLTMNAILSGSGSDIRSMVMDLEANVSSSDIMGYAVDSSYLNFNLNREKLNGKLWIADREGSADLDLDLDLSAKSAYEIRGNIDRLNLSTYNIYDKQPLWFSAGVDINLTGDSLDNTLGEVTISNTRLKRIGDTTEFKVEDFYLRTDTSSYSCNPITKTIDRENLTENINTSYHLTSSLLDAYLCGNFTLKKGLALTQRLITESGMYFANDDSLIQTYYEAKVRDTTDVNAYFSVTSKKGINEIFRFLETPVYISPRNTLNGQLDFANVDQVSLEMMLDSAKYQETVFRHIALNLAISKFSDRNYLLTAGDVSVDSVMIVKGFELQDVIMGLNGEGRNLETDLVAFQRNDKKQNRLQTVIKSDFLQDGRIVTRLDSSASSLMIEDAIWLFSDKNSLTANMGELSIRNLRLFNGDKFLDVSGDIARRVDSRLSLMINQLELQNLEDLIELPYQLNGILTAGVNLDNMLLEPKLTGGGMITGFGLDDFIYGDVWAGVDWSNKDEILELDARLVDENIQDTTLSLSGTYATKSDVASPLDFQIDTNEPFPLNYIYPFVKTQLYGIKGKVELSSFKIAGTFDDLDIRGKGDFTEAGFGVDYFKTEYNFDGLIEFDKNLISFPKKNGRSAIRLFDRNGNQADFYGAILHNGMREFEFDLQLDKMNNFLVMDTKKDDNELFYGKVFVKNGIASITGNLEKLEVQAFAISGAETNLKVPITFDSQNQKPEFVSFKGENDEEYDMRNIGTNGFDLNLSLQTTEEAQIELIFDERVGDIIQGRGAGTINLAITEAGDFSIYGDYEVTQGNYLFTASNIINKKFEVKSGGNISWDGDPYNAKLDLEAIYPLYADIRDLLQTDKSTRVPVNVLMHMEGSLLKPEISLSIDLPNLREQDAISIVSYLKSIQYDEQELNKQVFSLMVFNRFAPIGGLLGDQVANTGVTTSISEMLSNQLNYWLSRAIDENVSVSVGTTNFQDVDLLVSAKLFNDRVTIERDGTLVSSNQNRPTVGNVSIIIKLLPTASDVPLETNRRPSELVLEVFNRESLRVSTTDLNQNQTGIGLFYKKDFDNLKDLLTKFNKN